MKLLSGTKRMYIIKINNYYFEYSTTTKAPVSPGMELEEFKKYYRKKHGLRGALTLYKTLEQVEKYGTSSLLGETPEQLLANTGGLTVEELFKVLS